MFFLQNLSHLPVVVGVFCLFYRYFHSFCSEELASIISSLEIPEELLGARPIRCGTFSVRLLCVGFSFFFYSALSSADPLIDGLLIFFTENH